MINLVAANSANIQQVIEKASCLIHSRKLSCLIKIIHFQRKQLTVILFFNEEFGQGCSLSYSLIFQNAVEPKKTFYGIASLSIEREMSTAISDVETRKTISRERIYLAFRNWRSLCLVTVNETCMLSIASHTFFHLAICSVRAL